MIQVQIRMLVPAPREKVFDIYCDPQTSERVIPELKSFERRIGSGMPKVGDVWVLNYKVYGSKVAIECTVDEYIPRTRMVFTANDKTAESRYVATFKDAGADTEVMIEILARTVSPFLKPLEFFMPATVARMAEKNYTRFNQFITGSQSSFELVRARVWKMPAPTRKILIGFGLLIGVLLALLERVWH